jgi:hypothetical protein
MKAGDERPGSTASQESWHSAPLTDPNAALWASITPPGEASLQTLIRRRMAGLSLDLLAQRLWLRFPAFFSSRATAQRTILGGAFGLGAGLGVAGFLAVTALTAPADTRTAQAQDFAAAKSKAALEAPGVPSAEPRVAAPRAPRVGAEMTGASTLAATVAPAEPEQTMQALTPSDDIEEPKQAHRARHSATKKKAKAKNRSTARRTKSKGGSNGSGNSRARMLAAALGLK